MSTLPDSIISAKKIERVGFQYIALDPSTLKVKLKHKGMKIGFGAIGKGFIAEALKSFLIKKGIKAGLISAGGDICVWGKHPKTDVWPIAVSNPNGQSVICRLSLKDNAIVTSGNYEKFIEVNNKKYSHILNPKS
jgi:FAD:protein FMN transferase